MLQWACGSCGEQWPSYKLTVAFSSISPSQYGCFDVGTLFYSSHFHSARRLTYNWVSIVVCVTTVELTVLYCNVFVLQMPYYLAHNLILWYRHLNAREKIVAWVNHKPSYILKIEKIIFDSIFGMLHLNWFLMETLIIKKFSNRPAI